MIKRSVNIAGHATSISLEAPFWMELKHIAKSQKRPVSAIIRELDENAPANLSSAIRCYILEMVKQNR